MSNLGLKGQPWNSSITMERFQENTHLIMYAIDDHNILVCSTGEKQKRTNFICSDCSHKQHLHPKDCFMIYHKNSFIDVANLIYHLLYSFDILKCTISSKN